MKSFDLSLYLIADCEITSHLNLIDIVDQATDGGVTIVQLRAKKLNPHEITKIAKKLLAILRPKNIPLVINDYPQISKEVGAAGVHLGANDIDPKTARRMLGADAIIGLSIESKSDLSTLNLSDVDYIAAGLIFPTTTKLDVSAPFQISELRALRARYSLPIVAIGGIHSGNLSEVLSTDIDGVAVCAAICTAQTPKVAAIQLKRKKGSLPRVLTIAGSDSGGGAGIQADLKTIQALGCYGTSAITALTAQNTKSVRSIAPCDPIFVRDQLEAILEDIGTDAVKIGMLFSKNIINMVADTLLKYNIKNIVIDPVMLSKSGNELLEQNATHSLLERLVPLADIITPNIPESKIFAKMSLNSGQILVIKGGHADDVRQSDDHVIIFGKEDVWIRNPRIQTENTHGTGCTYSAAIASFLAKGLRNLHAIKAAREYLQGAIAHGATQQVGLGFGPVDHSWRLRKP